MKNNSNGFSDFLKVHGIQLLNIHSEKENNWTWYAQTSMRDFFFKIPLVVRFVLLKIS